MFLNAEPLNGFAETGVGGVYQTHKTTHANVASAEVYEPGTICRYTNSYLKGEGAAIYLKYDQGSASSAAAAGTGCILKAGTVYTVTNDYSDGNATGGVPFCIALMTMTDEYYGWFWISGVPPYFMTDASTRLDEATIGTDGNLDAGECFVAGTTDGKILPYANSSVQQIVGVSNAADSASNTVALSALRLFGVGWF